MYFSYLVYKQYNVIDLFVALFDLEMISTKENGMVSFNTYKQVCYIWLANNSNCKHVTLKSIIDKCVHDRVKLFEFLPIIYHNKNVY